MSFRLALLNPNTEPAHTAAMAAVAEAALPPGAAVAGLTAARGPRSVESAADHAVAAAEVVELVRVNPGHDAYLVACFDDPGVDAARELTEAPVVGIGEAAYRAACLVGRRFAVLTTLRRGIPDLEDAVAAHGLARRCAGVVAVEIPVAEQGSAFPETTAALVEAGRRAVAQLGADVLVLACGGMADVARSVQEQVGVPACDGVGFGALTCYGLWAAGLRTSKIGAFARPEPIPYEGMPALSAPEA